MIRHNNRFLRTLGGRGRGTRLQGRGRRIVHRGHRNNNNYNNYYMPVRRFRGRSSLQHTNRRTHVVPPASFTRSSVGRESETITVKTSYAVADVETYDAVMEAWSTGANTSKNCVTRVYVNKSGTAADVSTATPTATTSKRSITHLTGTRLKGHSTKVSVILAGGKKIYSATSTTQRNVNLREVESRHQMSRYHTPTLHLPPKADLINQKGFKLIKQTITGLGTLEFDYGHVCDFMTSVSHHDLTSGPLCSIDFSATIHSVPNPGYLPDSTDPGKVVSPPDFVFIRSKDPTLLLQGFNEASEETTLMLKASKEMDLFSLQGDRYLARTDIVNILPKPILDGIFRLPQPVRISKSTNVITSLTLAVYFNNPLDHEIDEPRLYFFENLFDYLEHANNGTVSRSLINLPSGTIMLPRTQVAPYGLRTMNDKGEEFKPGDRYMIVDLDAPATHLSRVYEDDEDSDSEISIITESLKNTRLPDVVPKTRRKLVK